MLVHATSRGSEGYASSLRAVDVRRNGLSPGLLLALVTLVLLAVSILGADTYPPDWNGGSGSAVHFQPVPWPTNDGDGELDPGDWIPYNYIGSSVEDPKVQDPSNGGTSPQNYVNVSSGCSDLTLPSIFYYFDSANDVLMFRWRVEQIAHTYAVGPTVQPASAVDPWKSAQWTVMMDIDGDGYRELAILIDGSSGAPGTQIDRMLAIYADTPNQSIDYVSDADIHLIAHNPTAFTDAGTGLLMNFQNSLTPVASWPSGNLATVWDYGTTRARLVDHGVCSEYFVDYQIPLAMLDASAVGGPVVTADTPIRLAFATANSLNDPLQKDVIFEGELCADSDDPQPFGDSMTAGGAGIDQPVVSEITASGCAVLSAVVNDTIMAAGCDAPLDATVAAVDFYFYRDDNGNGQPDDGGSWTLAAAGAEVAGELGRWQAPWDPSMLRTGQYLIGVRAEDDQGHITWSHLTEAEVIAQLGSIDPNFANPDPEPGTVWGLLTNTCGTAPAVVKTASVGEVPAGGTVQFTITVTAALSDPLTLSSLDDALPAGWSYVSTDGGSLSPTVTPSGGATGVISWSFAPAVIPSGGSGTLVFTAQAPITLGTYSNLATAQTNEGPLEAPPVEVAVGAPRLTISKTADVPTQVPGGDITYTITYANDSPVSVTNAVITDVLPTGVSFVSATGGGSYDGGTRTVTWLVGDLASGEGPFVVSFTVTVDLPYPDGAAVPLVNTATIDSDQSAPASDDASVGIILPLRVQKSASPGVVAAGGTVVFTIDYANAGTSSVSSAVLTDLVPAGFSFVSATGGGVHDGGTPGTVTWNLGTLPGSASGAVSMTLQASSPFTGANPTTNTVTFSAAGQTSVTDDAGVAVDVPCTTPVTYYFRSATTDVGAAGIRSIADTTAPTAATAAGSGTQTVGPGCAANRVEMGRFYQDPAATTALSFDSDVTATLFVDKSGSPQAVFDLELYDYDPITGAAVLLGSASTNVVGNQSNSAEAFTIPQPVGTVAAGHRLLWMVYSCNNHAGQANSVALYWDGTASPSQSTLCLRQALDPVLDKGADLLSAAPGDTVTYTLDFTNPGGGILTGAVLTDTLPEGVSYSSALLNGAPTAPSSVVGQVLTFDVNGAGDAAGEISGGNGGTLAITVMISDPFTAADATLVNEATLSTAESADVTDTATTTVQAPDLLVSKVASATLLRPGDSVIYTVTVANGGIGSAADLALTDDIPDQEYFTYVPGGCAVDTSLAPSTSTASCNEAGGVLTMSADQLGPGEVLSVSFAMLVTTSPVPPAGLTTLDNQATATSSSTTTSADSGIVTVTISTNPNLRISKSSIPAAGPLAANEVLTYAIEVRNDGFGAAADVVVSDPVPALTGFVPGSITVDGAPQSDVVDGDVGSFDYAGSRALWRIGALAGGASHVLGFQVILDEPLPNGTSFIDNVAAVTASNAATKDAAHSIDAAAAASLTLTKLAPPAARRPVTFLAVGASSATTIDVEDASLLARNDYIEVGGTDAKITDISGTTLTLATPVSGSVGATVNPVLRYTLRFAHTGTAVATNVVLTDPLPANTVFVAASDGGVHNGGSPGTVTWALGSLSPGDAGSVKLWVRPTTVGTFDNTATLDSNETAPVPSTASTAVGVLEPDKLTSTPVVSITSPPGTTAEYTMTVANGSSQQATNVSIEDSFEPGFSFAGGTTVASVVGTGSRTSPVDPADGDSPATWCCWTLDPGDVLTITFTADIADWVGAGTYQNDMVVSSDQVASEEFDMLGTAAEDVTVTENTTPVELLIFTID